MPRRPFTSCILLAVLTAPLNAQSGRFDSPTAGFVFSAGSRTVRPILGVPGATHIGAPVLTDVNTASIAPGGKWAFVTTAIHSVFVRGLFEGVPVEAAAPGAMEAVDRVAWSRDASFAVLYSSSARRLQRVRLADSQVLVDHPVDLSPWGEPATLAIDPSGRQIAFGVAGAGVYAMDGEQSPALLASMARPAAVAFSDTGRLYAVDADTRRIVEFAAGLSPLEFAVVEAVEGTDFEPVGLALSGTGKHLMLADKGARTVRIYETATRMLTDVIRLDFAPVHMQRLSSGATFLLNRAGEQEWLLVLDASDTPRVYFVPAGEEGQ